MNSLLAIIDQHRPLTFYILLGVALVLTRIPLIGKYFRTVNTMIHEAGHAFVTLLVSGEVIAVNIFPDTSGTTVTKAKSKFLQILIAAAGYPASSLAALLFLFLLNNGHFLFILFTLVSIALLLLILSIRNNYGYFWAGTFTLICLLLIYFNKSAVIYTATTFFSLILLVDSVLSAVTLFVLSIRNPKKAGDATNLARFTRIPATAWSILFLSISGFLAYLSIVWYFPPVQSIL